MLQSAKARGHVRDIPPSIGRRAPGFRQAPPSTMKRPTGIVNPPIRPQKSNLPHHIDLTSQNKSRDSRDRRNTNFEPNVSKAGKCERQGSIRDTSGNKEVTQANCKETKKPQEQKAPEATT